MNVSLDLAAPVPALAFGPLQFVALACALLLAGVFALHLLRAYTAPASRPA